MSANGHRGHSRSGHGQSASSTSKSLTITLHCPKWFSEGRHLKVKDSANVASPDGGSSSPSNLDGPKRRGRPSKPSEQPTTAPPAKLKSSAMAKTVGTRFSKRKANQLESVAGDVDADAAMIDADASAATNNLTNDQALNSAQDASDSIANKPKRQKTSSPNSKSSKTDKQLMTAPPATDDQLLPPHEPIHHDQSQLPVSDGDAQIDNNNGDLSALEGVAASIEPADDASPQPMEGVITRSAAKGLSKSATPSSDAAQRKANSVIPNQEDTESVANEALDEDASAPATPSGKGRGRWPNGAVKARNAAAAAALAKKGGITKKKGAPGKRKISDNNLVQAVYDRQAHLRSSYKDIRKALLKSEIVYLEKTLEELDESEDRYKQCPAYTQVVDFLDGRLTSVVARRENEEQTERQMLAKRREADAELAWKEFQCKVVELKEKYEMRAKQAVLDLLERYDAEDDDNRSVDGNENDPADLEAFAAMQEEEPMDIDTPVETEVTKTGKPAATKVKRGKRRGAEAPLSSQTPLRHAAAMLSAHTADEESEADKPISQPAIIAAPTRSKNKIQFDEHGVCIPNESKKGPQREEPNNRAIIRPWFEFDKEEIGIRNYPSELKDPNRAHFPNGNLHVDQNRGAYNLSGTADDYDQNLVNVFKLHPTMGLPVPGSVNPDGVFPRTDYDAVLKHVPQPLLLIDEEHPRGLSTSKSYDYITTERKWKEMEIRLKAGQYGALRTEFKKAGLATYDTNARDVSKAQNAVQDILDASEELEIIEREASKAPKSPSPSPIRKSARVKEKALRAQKSKSPAPLPVTPPPRPPPILSTAQLSCLADAAEIKRHEDYRHSLEPPIYDRSIIHAQPPPQAAAPRTQSQMPHLAFITNPTPPPGPHDLRPLAPQPHRQPLPHPPLQQQQPPPPPPPQQPQRSYAPVMMAPPPASHMMQFPPLQAHQPMHFYGSHQHGSPPPQSAAQPQQRKLRAGPNLRNLLPRTIHGEPAPPPGPPHGPPQHYFQGPPPPAFRGQERPQYYDGPAHVSPYRNEPYQPHQPHYQPGPPHPSFFPYPHQDPRRR